MNISEILDAVYDVIGICFCVFTSIIIFMITRIYSKSQKIKNQQSKDEFYMKEVTSEKIEDIRKILDALIDECFTNYLANNPEYSSGKYIPEEIESQIMRDVSNRVSVTISDGVLTKLSMYYNKNIIAKMISERVYLKVTSFVININTPNN